MTKKNNKKKTTEVVERSMWLMRKGVMTHPSSKAFSEEFMPIFVIGSGQQSTVQFSKAPTSKTFREINYWEVRGISLLQSNT